MKFLYPLGLIGLSGIPIIIIIYILRSKYNEQTVGSTYLWKLSERFLKRRNPLSGLTGLLSLLLQILTVAVISLAVARPVIVLPNAANDYHFVLDASGSMNMMDGKNTRFEKAKEEIIKVINKAADGSSYSLVYVTDEAEVTFENVTDKSTAERVISSLEASELSCDYGEALKSAQERFDENNSSYVYLVTDKAYANHENVRLINVTDKIGDNYSVSDVSYSALGDALTVEASVISYLTDKELDVSLFVDDEAEPRVRAKVGTAAGVASTVTLECAASSFSSFTVRIENSDVYAQDNSVTTYNLKSEKTFSIVVVSDQEFFLEAAFTALLNTKITTMTTEEYEKNEEVFGLYIFDSYEPDELPGGAVWLINTDSSIENSGFAVRDTVSLKAPATLEKSKSTASGIRNLLAGIDGRDISIGEYVKYSGMYLNFMTLFSYESNPLIFVGTNGLGNRQVVIGFDLHKSDIALSVDFIVLLENLLEYSFPDVIDKTNYVVGDDATVNILKNSENIKAFAPSGGEVYMRSDGSVAVLPLEEVGTYVISMRIAGVENTYRIYSGAHPDESAPLVEADEFSLSGEMGNEKRDGEYNPLTILFIALAILFIADWGVYCYEKYQLR